MYVGAMHVYGTDAAHAVQDAAPALSEPPQVNMTLRDTEGVMQARDGIYRGG